MFTTVPPGSVTGLLPPMTTSASPPAALLKTMTAAAWFSCAQATLLSKRQAPRSINAILPAGSARYGSAGFVPLIDPGGQPRPTYTTSPEKVLYAGFGVNSAIEAGRFPSNALLVTCGWYMCACANFDGCPHGWTTPFALYEPRKDSLRIPSRSVSCAKERP